MGSMPLSCASDMVKMVKFYVVCNFLQFFKMKEKLGNLKPIEYKVWLFFTCVQTKFSAGGCEFPFWANAQVR